MEGETARCAANPLPATTHLPGGIQEGGVFGHSRPLELWLAASRKAVGTPPPPRAVPAMNGQLGFSSNHRHPSPDRGLPALLPSQGGEPEYRGANKPQGASLTLDEGAAPDTQRGEWGAARPGPRPRLARWAGGRARGCRHLSAPGPAREGCEPPETLTRTVPPSSRSTAAFL